MKRIIAMTAALIVGLSLGTSRVIAQNAEELFQKGKQLEEVKGELEKAIEVYKNVTTKFPNDKTIVAKALLHMGKCYEKLGKSEAQKAYERIIKEFADQREVAAEARTRLAALAKPPAPTEPAIVNRLVLSGPSVDPMGAPSLDGRYMAVTDWETGDLAIRDLTTNQLRRLTKKGSWFESTEFALVPRFSPDGRQIAYTWWTKDEDYQLRLISTEGGEPRVLLADKERKFMGVVGWFPDGQQILVRLDKFDGTIQAASISVADGSVRVIKTVTGAGEGGGSLSPDGRYVVYGSRQKAGASEHDIYILSTDGKLDAPLVEHPADDFNPVWTPDGKRIIFASDRRGTLALWALEVVNGKPRGEPQLIRAEMGRFSPMGFTQNGSYYYGLQAGAFDVYLAQLDVEAGKVVEAPTPIKTHRVGTNTSPAWSPDGKYLAFYKRGAGAGVAYAQVELWIQATETGQQRNFPLNLNIMQRSDWSPDGNSLVLPGGSQGTQGVYRVDAQSGAVEKLFEVGPGRQVGVRWTQFLPDGKRLVFVRQGLPPKTSSIIVRNLQTGEEKELVRAVRPANLVAVRLSPDARRIGFIWSEGSEMQSLRVVPVEGGEVRELFKREKMTAIGASDFQWTPDGKYILTVQAATPTTQESAQGHELWRISVSTGEAQPFGLAMKRMGNLALHPDGKRLAFTGGEQKFEVWVMENFLPKPDQSLGYTTPLTRQVWAGPDVNPLGAPSPDGRYLTYMDEGSGDLAIRDLITGDKRQITNKGTWLRSMEFALHSVPSPDGKHVTYTWFNTDRFFDLRIVGLDGSEPRVVYRNPEVEYVNPGGWSPEGKSILALITRKDKSHQIGLVSVADGALRVLRTSDSGFTLHARFSPDGRYIAYDFPQQRGSRDKDIFVLAVDGGRETAVVRHAANDVAPEWTPDGKGILFGSDRTGSMSLWSIRVADGKPVGNPELMFTQPSWTRRPASSSFPRAQ